jgi:hypothetical protein
LLKKRKGQTNLDRDTRSNIEYFFKLLLNNLELIEQVKYKTDIEKIFSMIDYENNGYISIEEVNFIYSAENYFAQK